MAKRRATFGGKPVLETIALDIAKAAGSAITLEPVNFQLDDDEVAEIWCIDSDIVLDVPAAIVDDTVLVSMALVTDPSFSVANAPMAEAVFEDVETLFSHQASLDIDANATAGLVDQNIKQPFSKQLNLMGGIPLLAATSMGILTSSDAGIAVDFNVRIYFTRRKAGKEELVRTLLKRR